MIEKLKADTSKIADYFTNFSQEGFSHLDFYNKKGNQRLSLIFHPGNTTWAFSEFKVQYVYQKEVKPKGITLPDEEFMTEKGIKLRTLREELISKIGTPTKESYEKDGVTTIEYRTHDRNAKLVKRYRQVGYFAIYKLRYNRIIEYHFGFDYP
ncbi:MAG: hypothetical protein JSS79_20745 [Bacteroidetes bacterium]|nr:hypothetical protein [Bacteroidota bacterium]